jgi:hypothetical protein
MKDRFIAVGIVFAALLVIAFVDWWMSQRARCRSCGAEHALYPDRRCYTCYTRVSR